LSQQQKKEKAQMKAPSAWKLYEKDEKDRVFARSAFGNDINALL
jgi:hypothetical protein